MVKLYNVTIKPREYTTESQSQIVRFQVNIRNKIFNIPIFKDDTILMKDNYYDLFKYSELNGIKEKDSAIAYVKLFSNSIMSLYHKLGIHEVQGGMPNIGELVILKSINGDQFVFVPDTNKIFSKHWKNGFVSEGRMIRDSIYLIPLTHE
ncbi:MAG: hypothetical protein ABIN97_20935 [Ginsengibacter sp.]